MYMYIINVSSHVHRFLLIAGSIQTYFGYRCQNPLFLRQYAKVSGFCPPTPPLLPPPLL